MNGGNWVFVIEQWENAAMTTGRNFIERLVTLSHFPVIIVNHDARPPDDKGDRVIVKSELLRRSNQLKGEFLEYLDEEKKMGVYELVVH